MDHLEGEVVYVLLCRHVRLFLVSQLYCPSNVLFQLDDLDLPG